MIDKVETSLLASKGTVTFVDLVARFNRRDLTDDLMDMTLAEPEKEPGIRALLQVMAFQDWTRIKKTLSDPDRAPAFVKALGFAGTNQSTNFLRIVATDGSQSGATRLLAIMSLGRSSPGARTLMQLVQQKKLPQEFLSVAIQSLTLSPGPETRMFAAQQQELLVPAASRWPLEKLLAASPDVGRGKAAFQKARCINCHVVNDEGRDFGPALSDIGIRLNSKQLFTAILKPSQSISLGYEGVLVVTEEGTLHSGFVTGESKTTLSLRIPGGLRKDLPKATIEIRRPMKVSLMPIGIDAILSPQELVDLVGWLKTLRKKKPNK